MKRIDSYSFGRIVIDGTTYTKDVIIFPDRVFSPWWRKEGHNLCLDDLSEVLKAEPHILIIGKGYSGIMKVPRSVVEELRGRGIEVRAMKTTEAVELFNTLSDRKKKVAALHLTC